jgi:integrase
LGGYPSDTLAQARDKSREARDKIDLGLDPIAERKAVKAALFAAKSRGLTFADGMDRCLATKLDGFHNNMHRGQWRTTLETHAKPTIGPMVVSDIQVQDVLKVLQSIGADKTVTANRLRGRIEAVLSWAKVSGHGIGDNPARWAGNFKKLLPATNKLAKNDSQPAIALDDAAAWFRDLRKRDGFGARGLEFAAFTAARSGEVRGAVWSELDLDRALWIIPADRMKMDREHKVPLTAAALALLQALPRLGHNDLVFPAPRGGELSDMTLSAAMRGIHEAALAEQTALAGKPLPEGTGGYRDRDSKRPAVPHGLRSTFRDWVAVRTDFAGDMAEVASAHKISSGVEASYRRGDMIAKRCAMMAAWADFLTATEQASNIVRIK